MRESGVAFAIPTYAFILAFLALIGVGVGKCTLGDVPAGDRPRPIPAGAGAVTFFVLLRAFASGSAALTGIEAISNGVSAFRHPQARNAARTLAILGVVAVTFFIGVSWLAVQMHARPSRAPPSSPRSRAATSRRLGFGFMFWVVQMTTFAILVLAANTSFQGFPRLAALLARDRFFPRQFGNLGDRLVYSNGIIVLSGLAIFLLWYYHANVDSLIHLYVLGVFTAFTLSQAGMVRYWRRTRGAAVAAERGDQRASARSPPGSCWSSSSHEVHTGRVDRDVAIPLLVLMFLGIHRHYRRTSRRLRAGAAAMIASAPPARRRLIAVDAIDEATERAVWYAREIAGSDFRPVHVPGRGTEACDSPHWRQWIGRPAAARAAPGRRGTGGVAARVRLERAPAARPTSSTSSFRSSSTSDRSSRRSAPTSFQLKLRLLKEPGVVITDVPLVEGEPPVAERARRPRPRLRGSRRIPARHRLRRDARARRRPRRSSSPSTRRRRGEFAATGNATACGSRSTSSRRRSATSAIRCSRYLRELTGDGDGRRRGHARARRPRLAAAPSQPARPLPQAAAALRAARDPLERAVPARIARSSSGDVASRS